MVTNDFRILNKGTYIWCALIGAKIAYEETIYVRINSTHTTTFTGDEKVHYCTPYINGMCYDNIELEIWENQFKDKHTYTLQDASPIRYIDFPYAGTLNTKDNGNKK